MWWVSGGVLLFSVGEGGGQKSQCEAQRSEDETVRGMEGEGQR